MNVGEVVREFLLESHENLDQLDRAFVDLEKNPRDHENIAGIFRTIHTIKGTAGFIGFPTLERVTHAGETVLSMLRDGTLLLDREITSALLHMVDVTRQMLDEIESGGAEGQETYPELIAELDAIAHGRPAPAPTPDLTLVELREGERRTGDDRRLGVTDTSLRVDVGLLDRLMNLVGELVLSRNQLLQFTATHTESAFVGATQRLNLVTTELQEGVMKTRMQPIGNVWSKFPRVVRDIATICNKRVRLQMFGKDTELDKTILEAIKDPLTHIVRNSIDHGIESPDTRIANGKDPEGVLTLRAFHEGGQVIIEIQDDGAGIDPGRVRAKAIQRGVIGGEQAARLSDHDAIKLVFLPGFSTADTITNVSGRGVGMDVVRTNIEKIGGTVDIQSRVGVGTTLRIKIPLTLAIIPALIVTAGGERFAIPQVSLIELVRLEGEQAARGIEYIGDAAVYRLRGSLLPLVALDRELGLESVADPSAVNIVILAADDRQFGLIVDGIGDTEEIVVKPLGPQLKRVSLFAGATIMGDGRVALILDVPGLAQQANVIADLRGQQRDEPTSSAATASGDDEEQQTLLLFRVNRQGQMALPLSKVTRLEEFPASSVERSSDRDVVQYRGEILPLVSLTSYFTGAPTARDPMQVIVYADGPRSFGLIVEEILDVVQDVVTISNPAPRPGVLGSAIIQQRVTDLLDVQAVRAA